MRQSLMLYCFFYFCYFVSAQGGFKIFFPRQDNLFKNQDEMLQCLNPSLQSWKGWAWHIPGGIMEVNISCIINEEDWKQPPKSTLEKNLAHIRPFPERKKLVSYEQIQKYQEKLQKIKIFLEENERNIFSSPQKIEDCEKQWEEWERFFIQDFIQSPHLEKWNWGTLIESTDSYRRFYVFVESRIEKIEEIIEDKKDKENPSSVYWIDSVYWMGEKKEFCWLYEEFFQRNTTEKKFK